MYDAIVSAPGQDLLLGASGGKLTIAPPPPGSMPLTDLRARTWHLLREDGPDNGFPEPTTGDYVVATLNRDLNIALAQFISETGLAPGISARVDTFGVQVGQDASLPPGLVSLARVEYTPAGMQTRNIPVLSFTEWDNLIGNVQPYETGIPQAARAPWGGYMRLYPAPGAGNSTADTMTFYYTTLGTTLLLDGDVPGIPPQFHMALVYRVLADYWPRKQDMNMADAYMARYTTMVNRGKAYQYDANLASEPSIAGDDHY